MNIVVTEMSVGAASPAEMVEHYVKQESVDSLVTDQDLQPEPVKEEHQSKWLSWFLNKLISVIIAMLICVTGRDVHLSVVVHVVSIMVAMSNCTSGVC